MSESSDPGSEPQSYADGKAVARVNREFYRAFQSLDLEAMRAVWSEEPEIKCIHPGWDVLSGPERVFASWEAIFANTEKIRFDVADVSIDVVGDLAWVCNVEKITSVVEDREFESEAAATNLYARRDGAWLLLLHHASPIAQRFFDDDDESGETS